MSLREKFRDMLRRDGETAQPPILEHGGLPPPALRGRVSKVSIVKGGAVSVHVTFGVDEPGARMLDQGSLVALLEVQKAPRKVPKPKPGEVVIKQPGEE